jgi:hypothetical protein
MTTPAHPKAANPFRYFNSSPQVIRAAVMLYVRFPLSLRNVEYLLFERGIDICHETVRLWLNRFGPLFTADIRRRRIREQQGARHWRWRVDEMSVRLNGETGQGGHGRVGARRHAPLTRPATGPGSGIAAHDSHRIAEHR